VAITSGSQHGIALKADGRVWSWGYNGQGQLGDLTGTSRTLPTESFITDVLAISTSGELSSHSAAVRSDGSLWTWGKNDAGELGDGTTVTNVTPKPVPGFSLASTALWALDSDGDGLLNSEELGLGTDGRKVDTNGDGIPDGAAVKAGLSATNTDMDGDGVSNSVEAERGTDPFVADTDGDGVNDAVDCFPLDPTRWQCPAANPNDHTPPIITLTEPTNASLVSSIPPQ
jgi:hypothetical protein